MVGPVCGFLGQRDDPPMALLSFVRKTERPLRHAFVELRADAGVMPAVMQ